MAAAVAARDDELRVRVHPPTDAGLLYGELAALVVRRSGEVLGAGPITQGPGTLEMGFQASPELVESIVEASPHELTVRLAGMVITPYDSHLSDRELRDIETATRSLADVIAESLRAPLEEREPRPDENSTQEPE